MYVECKPDEVLVKIVVQLGRREIIHDLKGKFEVIKHLSAGTGEVAMVDEDPGANQPEGLKHMKVERDWVDRGLKRLVDVRRSNHVIVLCPRLEEWIIKAAEEAGLDMEKYGLPEKGPDLNRVINGDLRKFESLTSDLRTTARLRALRELLSP